MPLNDRLAELLSGHDVPFEVIEHAPDFQAHTAAHDTHTPARAFAKAVVLQVDGAPALAVAPASEKIDLPRLRQRLGAQEVRLLGEAEMARLFPDCELGAEPPLGKLYGLPTYVALELAQSPYITFNAGTHSTAVRMTWSDFVELG